MAYWVVDYVFALGASILLTVIIIPKILLIAFRKKLFDSVNERKIHTGIVPRLGGLAFMPSMAFSYCLVLGVSLCLDAPGMLGYIESAILPTIFMVCAITLMYLLGLADDLIGVRYRAKFVIQFCSAILLIVSGLWVKNLYGFMGIEGCPNTLGWIFTAICIIFVVNAVNLIDGIDGLASGLSMVTLIWYSVVLWSEGEYLYLILCGATLGTLIPFFYYNVFGKVDSHTKIFMGDTGSLAIGLVLVFLCLGILNTPRIGLGIEHNIFVIAIAPLIVPCFDAVRVFIHRLRRGRNPFEPDKCHIHHKMLALGMKQWQALILILVSDMVFVCFNYFLSSMVQPTWIILFDVVVWTDLNIMLTKMIRRRETLKGVKLYD